MLATDGRHQKVLRVYKTAFEVVTRFIRQHVIKKHNACTMQFAEKLFKEALIDECKGDASIKQSLCTKHISSKIKHHFGKKVKYQN